MLVCPHRSLQVHLCWPTSSVFYFIELPNSRPNEFYFKIREQHLNNCFQSVLGCTFTMADATAHELMKMQSALHQGDEPSLTGNQTVFKKPFSCSKCGKVSTTNQDLKKHERIHLYYNYRNESADLSF